MKISILQKNFKQGLGLVGSITGKQVNLPILNNILIRAENGIINLVSTNLEIGITHVIRGKIEKEGGYTVDSKILANYVGLLPNEKVEIERKDAQIIIRCGKYNTKINGQPIDDFPLIPVIGREIFYAIKNTDDFKNALSQVIFSVSTSESRLELSGALFSFSGDKLVLAATDSYRLAEKRITVKTNAKDGAERKVIVPARTIQEMIRILSGLGESEMMEEEKEIKCFFSENQILFKIGGTELVSRLIDGQFPDYTQIIPEKPRTTIIVNRQEFLRAVKASSIFTRSDVNDINLDIPEGKSKLVISSSSDFVGENVVEVEAAAKGADNCLVLNYRYLIDGLNNIKDETVIMEIVDNNSPCIIRPESDPDYLYIIMPIKR